MKKEASLAAISWEEKLAFFGAKPMSPEALEQTHANRQQSYFREKYLKGLRTVTRIDMHQLRKEHPEWGLKELLSAMLPGYSPELPPQVLLMMAQFIAEEWEKSEREEGVVA
ncbi:MAG: hypothetical protein AAB316_03720 [Bacteroidota bacterium]